MANRGDKLASVWYNNVASYLAIKQIKLHACMNIYLRGGAMSLIEAFAIHSKTRLRHLIRRGERSSVG